jgi:L-aspartate oxidase
MTTHQTKVLVIGSGASGLTLALHLAKACDVTVLSKSDLQGGASYHAQGGVAAVFDERQDSLEQHIKDTLVAGAGLCDPVVVEKVVHEARESIEWLIDLGVDFTHDVLPDGKKQYHLTREGGHSSRRILHSADATGKAVKFSLDNAVVAHPNITVFEDHIVVDLIIQKERCVGAYVLNNATQRVETFQADFVVLATGGASRVYLYTTNPDVASGDGIAIAARAGCRVANLEFNQFHPTCLYHTTANSFLISEALRGEGAVLRLPTGERFMDQYHVDAELAPRDVVARAIDDQMKRFGYDYVHLDITHQSPEFIKKAFPTIYKGCLALDIDITTMPIPVVPAAHYTCGGVVTDMAGQTELGNLYAIGEVACTGLHGANRMASNSLLECLVFAKSASQDILAHLQDQSLQIDPIKGWDESLVMESDEEVVIHHNWDELRRSMWNYVGIVRTDRRLQRAATRIALLKQEVKDYYEHYKLTKNMIELRNLVIVADLMVQCALQRKESRGLHYTLDYPERSKHFDGVMTVV